MAISTSLVLKFNGAAVKRGLAGMKASFAKVGGAIKTMGIGLAAFAAASAVALAAAAIKINLIGEAAVTSENRLKSVTKQMGIFGTEADNVSKRLIDLSQTQARMLGIDNKVITLTQSKLMTFAELANSADDAGGAFDRATMAAINMAAAGFGTAEMNAVQLGKALNDPIKGITSLTKSGITFTQNQKDVIKALVETGNTAKAQDLVLKAIETQVGGTAAATADASAMVKESFDQIVQAFAKPFSTGFANIPAALESVFPQIKAKAEELGQFIGSAIGESIAGDHVKFIAIGELIGDLIGGAMKSTFDISVAKTMGGISKLIFSELGGAIMDAPRQEKDEMNEMIDRVWSNAIKTSLQDNARSALNKYAETVSTKSPTQLAGEQSARAQSEANRMAAFMGAGITPRQSGVNESNMFEDMPRIEEMIRQTVAELKNVNRNLSPTP
jgi:hypothetical protein